MHGDDYIQEEFGRRTIEIGNLRDVLFGEKDRVAETKERYEFLLSSISKTRAEISIRKSKANELEDRAALGEAGLEDASRALAADRIAGVGEVARVRQEMEEVDQASVRAQSALQEARKLAAEAELEETATQGRLEAVRRDIERAREALARDEAAEELRQARLAAQRGCEGAERMRAAQAELEAAEDEAAALRERLRQSEASLASEKGTCEELRSSLDQQSASQAKLAKDCEALRQELAALEQQRGAEELREVYDRSREEFHRLSHEVNTARRQALLQTQSIQGALDETRRMLSDHLDQTHRQLLDQTTRTDSSLGVFTMALSDARAKAASAAAAKLALEDQCAALEGEVRRATEELAAQRAHAKAHCSEEVVEQLAAARAELETASRKASTAADEARRAEDAAAEAALAAGDQERLLRGKLEQLWGAVRQCGALGAPVA